MYRLRKYLLVTILLTLSYGAHAQWGMDTLSNVIRPRVGLGVGTMTYYGEVQNYQKGFTPTINRYYGLAYVNAPLTKYLNLEISASYGKVSANERSLVSNLNFQSRIRMLSAQVYYNMYPVLNNRRLMFHPFFGIGISSFEFLSKTDLYDGEGNQYHYWSDGSIMNMAEDDPLAVNAVPLTRDYVYESDLREQNLDGLGDYKEQSFSFPLTAGIEFHLSPRWDFRIASTFHFTFTDLIDNVTPAGQGPERHGDGKNDKLWTNYITLSYDLQIPKKSNGGSLFDDDIELYADFEQNDWDNDGVIDAYDECPDTPLEALVDEKGCPLDGDGDGVPDYRDDEPNTPEGNFVDEFGVTMTEEDIAKHWREFNDSTGYEHDFVIDEKTIEFGKDDVVRLVNPYENKKDKSYVIIIGKEHKDVSANELHEYLGYADFETEVRGDTVYYKLGEYATIEDAVAAKSEMEKQGIEVELIGRDGSVDSTFFEVSKDVVDKVDKLNKENNKEAPVINKPDEQVFRVQIGAFKNKVNEKETFKGVENITHATSEDGITRYYSGKFKDYKEANEYRKKLIGKGYRSAFVVAYKGHERKTLQELDVDPRDLPDYYDEKKELETFVEPRDKTEDKDTSNSNIINGIDMTKVKYRIKLAEYADGAKVPTGDLDIFLNIGNVKPVTGKDGKKVFYSPPFDSESSALDAIEDYKTYGLDNMKTYVEYDNEFFTVEEFNEKLKP